MPSVMKPGWLKIRPPDLKPFEETRSVISSLNLHTICVEGHCPNQSECWSNKTASFMVLGKTCTRGCKFCAVSTALKGDVLDSLEPARLGAAVKRLGLEYVVITSVDRDDLEDQGAGHIAQCIREVRRQSSSTVVEALIPDFRGSEECLQTVLQSNPHVLSHNLETVKRLQSYARDRRASYEQSLGVLKNAKKQCPSMYTKSALMLGLGETQEEVIQSMKDLRVMNVDFLSLGQYLRPSEWHVPVHEYVSPDQFKWYEEKGFELGFKFVAAGPFVRSSYRAGEYFVGNMVSRV
ncbi:MAG: lipoyl synthase [Candidatus Diapherotrites archaeon]|nr:lipoyl synthase [Candidatus Diapherotrites archaeon]